VGGLWSGINMVNSQNLVGGRGKCSGENPGSENVTRIDAAHVQYTVCFQVHAVFFCALWIV